MPGRKFGHIVSIETRNKLAISHTGKKHSIITKEKMSKASRGKKKSLEHIKNVVIARMKSCKCGWKGDFAGEEAMHKWIEKLKGKPMKCEHCGVEGRRRYHWSNKYHTYKRREEDWQRLCVPCHIKYDMENNNRPNNYKSN
jgi:hypothetical protein